MGFLDSIIGELNGGSLGGGDPMTNGAPPSGSLPPMDSAPVGLPQPAPAFPGGVPLPRPRPPGAMTQINPAQLDSFYDAIQGAAPGAPIPRPRPAGAPTAQDLADDEAADAADNALTPASPAVTVPSVRRPVNVSLTSEAPAQPPAPTGPGTLQSAVTGAAPSDQSNIDVNSLLKQVLERMNQRSSPMSTAMASLGAGLAKLQNSPFKGQAFANGMGNALQGGQQSENEDLKDKIALADAASKLAPKFTKIGQGVMGEEQYGFVNPNAQKVTPYVAPGSTPVDAAVPGATGDTALKGLPIPMQTLVKKVANYEVDPRTLSVKGGHRERVLSLVSQYDPSYDAPQYASRAQAIKEFNNGGPNSPAGTITAGNTAIQHLGSLSDAAEKLDNGSFKLINSVRNFGRDQTGDPRVTEFNNIRNKYVEEATKFYRGTGGSEADIKRDIDNLNAAQSPAQLRAAIAASAELMQSKINALQDRWKTATGQSGWSIAQRQAGQDFPIVQQKSATNMDRIRARANPDKTVSDAKAAMAAGVPRDKVIERLKDLNIDSAGL